RRLHRDVGELLRVEHDVVDPQRRHRQECKDDEQDRLGGRGDPTSGDPSHVGPPSVWRDPAAARRSFTAPIEPPAIAPGITPWGRCVAPPLRRSLSGSATWEAATLVRRFLVIGLLLASIAGCTSPPGS